MLIALNVLGHALVWRFMAGDGRPGAEEDGVGPAGGRGSVEATSA
ncbi:hypothetical protein [Streptomyces sp. NPDC097619]